MKILIIAISLIVYLLIASVVVHYIRPTFHYNITNIIIGYIGGVIVVNISIYIGWYGKNNK